MQFIREKQPVRRPIMKRLRLAQFPIQNLMILIGAIACTLSLLRWVGLLATIVILVFPISLLVERLFGTTPTVTKAPLSFVGTAENFGVLILCVRVYCRCLVWIFDGSANDPIAAASSRCSPFISGIGTGLHGTMVGCRSNSIRYVLHDQFLSAPGTKLGSAPDAILFSLQVYRPCAPFSISWEVGNTGYGIRGACTRWQVRPSTYQSWSSFGVGGSPTGEEPRRPEPLDSAHSCIAGSSGSLFRTFGELP